MKLFLVIIKGPPNNIYCIIEEPSKYNFTEKVSYSFSHVLLIYCFLVNDMFYTTAIHNDGIIFSFYIHYKICIHSEDNTS